MSEAARKRVEVAAAVIVRPDGHYLLGQRAADTVYAGYWEFPGGKVEPGETALAALKRELDEELGIRVQQANPWIVREYHYEHAHVRLHFFEVTAWEGAPQARIHAALAWQHVGAETVAPMLPANAPVLRALALPRVMGITHAWQIGLDAQREALDRALAQGVKLVQLREAPLEATHRLQFGQWVRARTHVAGALLMVNGDEDLARAIGADGLHLPGAQLQAASKRPDFEWVSAACHTAHDVTNAVTLGLDFILVGPVLPTTSHPGEAGIGWAQFARLAAECPLPVLAIGGMTAGHMDEARHHGAHGIAAIRSVWGG